MWSRILSRCPLLSCTILIFFFNCLISVLFTLNEFVENSRKSRAALSSSPNRISMLYLHSMPLRFHFFLSLQTFVHCLPMYCHGSHVCFSFHLPLILMFPQWNQERKKLTKQKLKDWIRFRYKWLMLGVYDVCFDICLHSFIIFIPFISK